MRKKRQVQEHTPILTLLLIYAGFVLVRFLLAMATRHYPTVSIDEFLYYSLGRSIATDGSLLYHGQAALYNYIVYPLVIAPIYGLFPQGTNYYQIIQLWNIMIMTSSVFPVYGICNELLQNRKKALWITALCMLMPQFILGEYIYSEAVIYPLFFTVMYCVFRYLGTPKTGYAVWTGILGAVLYYTKPGAVLPAAAALLFFAVRAVTGKSRKNGIQVLTGALGFVAVFFALKILAEKGFGYQGSLFSLYDEQMTQELSVNTEYFFRNAGLYPYYFLLACGILPFIVSVFRYREYSREERQYYLFAILCVLVTMIGVAWLINRPERKDILYLRYVEMYIPIFLVYSLIPGREEPVTDLQSGEKQSLPGILLIAYAIACTAIWGCSAGIGRYAYDHHFLVSLSILFHPHVTGIANILAMFICGATLYLTVGKTGKNTLMKVCCGLFAALTLLNNIQGYASTAGNTDPKLAEETAQVHQVIGDQEYLFVYTEDQSDFGLDVNSRRNIFQVTSYEFIDHLQKNGGVYVPFVPMSMRGMSAQKETPDVDLLVVDEHAYRCIQFSSVSEYISFDNSLKVVRIRKGEQILSALLVNAAYPKVSKESSVILQIYQEELLREPVKLRLEIESDVTQNLEITGNDRVSIQLSEGRFWYEIEMNSPADEYSLTVQDHEIQLHSFEVVQLNPNT